MAESVGAVATPRRSGLIGRGFGWYSSAPDARLRRRPTDALLLVVTLLCLVIVAPAAPGPTTIDESLAEIASAVPEWLHWVFAAGYAASALWAMLLILVALVSRRWRLAGVALLAAVLAYGVSGLAGLAAGTGWDGSWSAFWSVEPPPTYTAVRVAVVTATILAAHPHLSRPVRAIGRTLLAVVAISAVIIGVAYPIGAVAGFFAGASAAAAVHLLIGSPAGRPTPARVTEALADLGLADAEVTDTEMTDALAATPPGGGSAFDARVPGQPALRVHVLGRDEWDAQVVTSAWTAATRRGERARLAATRLERVEHAAMVTLLAERAGVRVLPVVIAGRSAQGDAVLVTAAATGPALADLPAEQVTDAILADAWAQVLALHAAGIAHRRLDGSTFVLDEQGRPVLRGLGEATVGADPRDLMVDRARLLVTTAMVATPERALAAAQESLGPEGLAALLPYLQPAVLDRSARRRVRAGSLDLVALREQAAVAAGVELPPLEQVRRVTKRALVRAVLIVLLSYFLISSLAGVDLSQIWSELASADWAWIGLAFIVSPLAQVSFAFSTLGATTATLRYFPVLMLQFALQFIAVALPATAARIAMDIRFFQSFGVAAGASVSIGMIDSFSGFVVQVILLALILLSGLPGFTEPMPSSSSSGSDSSSSPSLLALMLVIGVLSILVVLIVPKLRQRFAVRLRSAWAAFLEQARHARGALDVLRHPGKVGEMLLGNLGGQVVQAIVLGLCLAAFGNSAHLSQLILINTAVSLFAGLMPVPGGVGVSEAGITAGLQAIGVPSAAALSTAIAFRLVTFYLPPLWGSLAMRWLRRRSYV